MTSSWFHLTLPFKFPSNDNAIVYSKILNVLLESSNYLSEIKVFSSTNLSYKNDIWH